MDCLEIEEEQDVTILLFNQKNEKNEKKQKNDEDNEYFADTMDMIDERCEQINHQIFQKYVGLNRYVVFIVLSLLNPRKQIMMFSKKYLSCFLVPFQKNTINIVYDDDNKVIKIRYNSIKKIE